MKPIAFPLIGIATLAGVVAFTEPAANQGGAPIFVTDIPPGYRDWRLISVAHEEGNFRSFSAVLGNDLAIQAYREGKIPFPDGAIIAALHYRHVPSEENNKVFGQAQSFVPGTPTNIQFMVKDTKKYSATGGWGFAHFQDGAELIRRGSFVSFVLGADSCSIRSPCGRAQAASVEDRGRATTVLASSAIRSANPPNADPLLTGPYPRRA
jgi:hypothetical protein